MYEIAYVRRTFLGNFAISGTLLRLARFVVQRAAPRIVCTCPPTGAKAMPLYLHYARLRPTKKSALLRDPALIVRLHEECACVPVLTRPFLLGQNSTSMEV